MKTLNTTAYTSTVREYAGFTSNSVINSQLAVDFGNGNTMTVESCISHLYNLQAIDWKTRKSLSKKSEAKKLELINLHYSKFKF